MCGEIRYFCGNDFAPPNGSIACWNAGASWVLVRDGISECSTRMWPRQKDLSIVQLTAADVLTVRNVAGDSTGDAGSSNCQFRSNELRINRRPPRARSKTGSSMPSIFLSWGTRQTLFCIGSPQRSSRRLPRITACSQVTVADPQPPILNRLLTQLDETRTNRPDCSGSPRLWEKKRHP